MALLDLSPYFKRAAVFSMIGGLLMLSPTFYMQEVYDRVVNSRSTETLLMLTLLVLFAILVMEGVEWVRSEILHAAGEALDHKLKDRVFDAMFRANLRTPGVWQQMPLSDLRMLVDFIGQSVMASLLQAPVSIVFLLLIFMIHPSLGWSALAGVMVQVILAFVTERKTQPPLLEANKAAGEAGGYAQGVMRSAEVVEAMGMQRGVHARWMQKQRKFLGLQATASDHAGGLMAVTKSVQMVQGSALLGLGCWLTLQGQLSGNPGDQAVNSGALMIVASILGSMASTPIVQVVTGWKLVASARDSYSRLSAFLQSNPASQPGMPLPPPKGELLVQNLTAGAPGQPNAILRGVNFAVKAGDCVALVGPSGSGKTTLARLLVGIWPAAAGGVRLDGADVYAWDKVQLGPHLGYLPQGVELFNGTVAENIARFSTVDMGLVREAANLMGLDSFVNDLPQGYETPIGDDGAVLSGGQRQRVGLARAIYGQPRLVVLDEPNSSLDEQGEAILLNMLRVLKSRGVTTVVITHRVNLLAVVDQMVVLRDGAVVAQGPRDDVLKSLRGAA
jgi:ATP-binding cassette subfamily C exporter for protease/lipase